MFLVVDRLPPPMSPCPPLTHNTRRDVWYDLKDMQAEEAMAQYVGMIDTFDSEWLEKVRGARCSGVCSGVCSSVCSGVCLVVCV